MIAASELRLGNYVNSKREGLSVVSEIRKYDNRVGITPLTFKNYVFHDSVFHPIPLTPEILEKCGFKKSLNGYCYGMITRDGKNRFSIFADGAFKLGTQDLSVNIHHLHQIQNLYFALTGEELNYTP